MRIMEKIITLGLLALVGYIAGRTKYLPDNSGVILSRLVIKLTAPILIVTTLASQKFTGQELSNGLRIYGFGLIFILFSFVISRGVSSRLNIEDSTRNIYQMHAMFGNVMYLAFPLLGSDILYGEKGLVFAVFYNLANDTVLWTLGIYLVNKHNTVQWKDNLKHLINGNTIAFIIGLFFIIINLQGMVESNPFVRDAYGLLNETFSPLGKTTIYLSMLFIGLILSDVKIDSFKALMKRYPIFILSFFKLLFIPLAAFGLFSLLGDSIDPIVKGIVVLQLAMPCATIVPALAAQYESDYKFATENVFFTTLFFVGTLPLMVWLVK